MKQSILMNAFAAGLLAAVTCLPVTAASSSADQAISAAEAAIAEANSNDWIWRDTEKFLSQARAAAEKGDDATAIKLADKARNQAQLAIKQYHIEEEADRGL